MTAPTTVQTSPNHDLVQEYKRAERAVHGHGVVTYRVSVAPPRCPHAGCPSNR